MTRIDPDRINLARARVSWVVRGLGTALLVWGAYLVLKRLLFGIGSGDVRAVFVIWSDDLGERSSVYRGLAALLVGGTLTAMARPLGRFVVSLPADECPRCSHERSPDGAEDRCPECGLRWERGGE